MTSTKTTIPFTGTAEQKAALEKVIADQKGKPGALMPIMQKAQDHFTVAEMLEMQKTLRDKYTQWERYSPEAGPNHLLWMIL